MKYRIPTLLLENLSEIITPILFESLLENAETISPLEAVDLILNSKGAVFTVKFIKKDGTERVLNGRLGVTKHLKGGELRYDAVKKGVIPVYDMQTKPGENGYRMINTGAIKALRINGVSYNVNDLAENAIMHNTPQIDHLYKILRRKYPNQVSFDEHGIIKFKTLKSLQPKVYSISRPQEEFLILNSEGKLVSMGSDIASILNKIRNL